MPKTGGTHVSRLIQSYFGGVQVGKHQRPPQKVLDRAPFIIGSVRNPWDWYVSLWAFGCAAQGDLHRRLGERQVFTHLKVLLSHPKGAILNLRSELAKPITQWYKCYENVNDPALFRCWLQLMYDPKRRFDLREGYAYSCLYPIAGFMTYRYLKLHCRDIRPLYERGAIATFEDLKNFRRDQNMLKFTIRTEHLEWDLLEALTLAGYTIDGSVSEAIFAERRSNTTEHQPTEYYYDEEMRDLVAKKERLIIERYGYEPPF